LSFHIKLYQTHSRICTGSLYNIFLIEFDKSLYEMTTNVRFFLSNDA